VENVGAKTDRREKVEQRRGEEMGLDAVKKDVKMNFIMKN
jgi:hypothetical protein